MAVPRTSGPGLPIPLALGPAVAAPDHGPAGIGKAHTGVKNGSKTQKKHGGVPCINSDNDTGSRSCFFHRHYYLPANCIARPLPHLRPSQVQGLARWVGDTILARSSC